MCISHGCVQTKTQTEGPLPTYRKKFHKETKLDWFCRQ